MLVYIAFACECFPMLGVGRASLGEISIRFGQNRTVEEDIGQRWARIPSTSAPAPQFTPLGRICLTQGDVWLKGAAVRGGLDLPDPVPSRLIAPIFPCRPSWRGSRDLQRSVAWMR